MQHQDRISGAVFSSDEMQVLSCSVDGTARLWDAQTGRERVRLRHEASVSFARFSFDGRRVLTWSAGVTRLWDASRGDKLATFEYGSGSGNAQLAKDGSCLLTWVSGNATAALWRISWSPEDLVNCATAVTNRLRPLSKVDRCRAYLDSEGCYELGGASERDLAVSGNLLSPKGIPSGVGNLADFAVGALPDVPLAIEVAVNASGTVVFFHNLPLPNLSRFRFYRVTQLFDIVRKDGEVRNSGVPLGKDAAFYLERADRALMVLVNTETDEMTVGDWLPLDVY